MAWLRLGLIVPVAVAGGLPRLVPFHCWISVLPVGLPVFPTAHAAVAEAAAMLDSPLLAPGRGLVSCDQLVPFQLRIRVLAHY
jgi:hypothetical protein